MKRVFAFLLSLVLVFSSFGAFAAEPGKEVQVTIQFTCEAGAYGFDLLGPNYPEELTFVKATPSVGFAGAKGWSYAGLAPVTSATCTYTFMVAADAEVGVYFVDMEVEGAYDANYASIPASVTEEKVFVGEHVHTEETIDAVPATCTVAGLTAGTFCPVCKTVLVEQEEVPALGHVEVIDKAVEPSCTETGLTEGKHCERCGDEDPTFYVKQDVVPALGHTPGEAKVENEVVGDCVTAGSYDSVVYCTVCEEEISRETKTSEPTGHKYEAVVTAPTCTEKGYTTYTCPVCEDTFKDNYVDVIDHSYEAVVTEPTCVSAGYTTYTCTECGASYVGDEVEAKGHKNLVKCVGLAATCDVAGQKDFVFCRDCYKIALGVFESDAELQAALDASEIVATVGADGSVNFPEDILIPALGHDYVVDEAVAATCETAGLTEGKHCTRCDSAVAQETIPATGHKLVIFIGGEDATCTEVGYKTFSYCMKCGKAIEGRHDQMEDVQTKLNESEIVISLPYSRANTPAEFIIPVADHTEEIIPAVAPTYTETGLTEGVKCSVCGAILVEQEIVPVLEPTEAPKYTVEKVSDTRGKVTYVENVASKPLEEVFVKITWRMTLSNEDTIGIVMVRDVKEDGTFKIGGITIPEGATMNFIHVEVVADEDADEMERGTYENYGQGVL